MVGAVTIVGNKGARQVWLGLDSEGFGHVPGQGISVGRCVAQQCIVRRLLWRRGWSEVQVSIFCVPSALNPADPRSRLLSLASRYVKVRNSRCLLTRWMRSRHMPRVTPLPAFPWPLLR